MKLQLYALAAGVFYLCGCTQEYPCSNFVLNKIRFETEATADTLTDTLTDSAAHCIVYKKGSNFETAIDSGDFPLTAPNINVRMLDFGRKLGIREQFDRYDWSITMYPSKRRYDMNNITFSARYTENKDRNCSNSLRYSVNGTSLRIPGTSGAGSLAGEIKVNY